jgi:DNA-binding CsgD family transcriptional regulator
MGLPVDTAADEEIRIASLTPDGGVVLSNGSALTPRELEILELLTLGRRNQEIASRLFSSVHTVEYHVTHILQKLNVRNRTEASMKAVQLGLPKLPYAPHLRGSLEVTGPTDQERRSRVSTGRRLVVPLLLALNGVLVYVAVLGAPFDFRPDGPSNAVAHPSETTVHFVPPP